MTSIDNIFKFGLIRPIFWRWNFVPYQCRTSQTRKGKKRQPP
uniref:Uncharacterized protein n=1 Tax=Anguilla anguilla TaxID=7936 RepID=A0A0E9WFU0_ANGAN